MLTPKEITINYLKSIKKDRENSRNRLNCTIDNVHARVGLSIDINVMDEAINVVKESEGE